MAEVTRSQWLEERRTLIGASDTPAILGVGYSGKTPASIWADKIGAYTTEDTRVSLSIGSILQPAIVRIAQLVLPELPISEEPANFTRRHSSVHYIGASLDAIAGRDEQGFDIPFEIKNVDRANEKDWEVEPPLPFAVQLQHQMFVTGASHGYAFALIGGNKPVWHRVERNDEFIAAMLSKLASFWSLVEKREPPPYEDPADQARVLAAMYPRDAGTSIALQDGAAALVDARDELGRQMDELKAQQTSIDNCLKLLLGDNAYGFLPDGRCVAWRTQHRKGYTVEPTSFRVLGILKKPPKDAPLPALPNYEEVLGDASARLIAAGAEFKDRSPFGSRYLFLADGRGVRLADHAPNEKTAAWMERNSIIDVRADQPNFAERVTKLIESQQPVSVEQSQ